MQSGTPKHLCRSPSDWKRNERIQMRCWQHMWRAPSNSRNGRENGKVLAPKPNELLTGRDVSLDYPPGSAPGLVKRWSFSLQDSTSGGQHVTCLCRQRVRSSSCSSSWPSLHAALSLSSLIDLMIHPSH